MAAVLGFGPGAQAQSQLIFDNLSRSVSAWGDVGANIMGQGYTRAGSFTTDAGHWTFESVTLGLANAYQANGGFAVRLYDATGADGNPGALLLTLTGNNNPKFAGSYSYTGALGLTPNTTYWVEADAPLTSDYRWGAISQSPTVGSQVGSSYAVDGGPWSLIPGYNMHMQVTASPTTVPEPSAMAFMGLSSAALLIFRRRK